MTEKFLLATSCGNIKFSYKLLFLSQDRLVIKSFSGLHKGKKRNLLLNMPYTATHTWLTFCILNIYYSYFWWQWSLLGKLKKTFFLPTLVTLLQLVELVYFMVLGGCMCVIFFFLGRGKGVGRDMKEKMTSVNAEVHRDKKKYSRFRVGGQTGCERLHQTTNEDARYSHHLVRQLQ